MDKQEAIDAVMADFPFEAVVARMAQKPRWYWGWKDRHIPTPEEARKCALFLLREANPQISTGGFTATVTAREVCLSFGKTKTDVWASCTKEIS